MELIETDHETYKSAINDPYHIFNSVDFNLLNQNKCEKLYFLLFKEQHYRLGLIAGLNDGILYSPFSSPYGSYSFINKVPNMTLIESAIDATEDFAKSKNIKEIKHILPPLIYGNTFVSKLINIFYRKNYEITHCDINHYFTLSKFDEAYANLLRRNARKNLAIGLKSKLEFHKCNSQDEKKTALGIIKANRKARGFPMRMNFEEVKATTELIEADFFIVKKNKSSISSAIVFHVAPKIVRVIYWGDKPGFTEYKAMNFLSFKIFEYYSNQGKDYVDIGISTDNSIPNYGLIEFKESIGCDLSPEFSFRKQI